MPPSNKMCRKKAKARQKLLSSENLRVSTSVTQHVVVFNGGLMMGVSRELLLAVFSPYGSVTAIILQPGKSYAFLSFSKQDECRRALLAVDGTTPELVQKHLQQQQGNSGILPPFYVDFVSKVPTSQPDVLSDEEQILPPGLAIHREFISEEEEGALLATLSFDAASADENSGSVMKHRTVEHFGYEFLYGSNSVDRSQPLARGLPEPCKRLLCAAKGKGWISRMPDQLTVNRYLPGQGIPAHVDTHSAFQDEIIVFSLCSAVVVDFRNPLTDAHLPVWLPARCLAVMRGESRYLWLHGITSRKSDVVPNFWLGEVKMAEKGLTLVPRGIRTSFTFRTLAEEHEDCNCDYPTQCDSKKQESNLKTDAQLDDRPALPTNEVEAIKLEDVHVHKVYEAIASHFSHTRHTPWPKVVDFVNSLPCSSFLLDVGCGNGKYLGVNKAIYSLGNDRSGKLLEVCGERGNEVFLCDILRIPTRDDTFDACLCIAVIHHLATPQSKSWCGLCALVAKYLSTFGRWSRSTTAVSHPPAI